MKLKKLIDEAKTIGIISHINPDADNLGSLTGLAESLRLYDKNVIPICIDPIPYNLEYLHGIDKLQEDYNIDLDILFILDSSDLGRLGDAAELYNRSKTTVAIDHHISNNMEVDFKFLDITASSTGEILYKFLNDYNLPINGNIAESIFTAISGDSGSFRYDTVSKETFTIAGELLGYGIDINKINNNLYGSNRFEKIQMLQRALSRIEIYEDKKLAMTHILIDDYIEIGAVPGDIEGIVETIRDIDGIEIAVFLRQTKDGIKGSSRSKNDYDVRLLAEKFGGGGHKKAAGFHLDTNDIDKAKKLVLSKI